MIDKIVGICCLPVSLLLFLNIFGITHIESIIGMNILFIAALCLILIQIANVAGAHVAKEYVILSYILSGVSLFPAILYFISAAVSMPETLTAAFPGIFASFIFLEGIYGFYL